jgi:hypothetical protein
MEDAQTVGYIQLLKQNPDFRKLWLGQVISDMGDWLGLRRIRDGFRYIAGRPDLLRYVLVKGLWGVSGGGLMFITVLLSKGVAMAESIAIGFFYAARALGTGVGPVLSRKWFPNETQWPYVIGGSLLLGGLAYGLVGWTYATLPIAFLIFIAHMATGSNWVLSTTFLQKHTEDEFRGRVFASESILYTLIPAVSQFVTAYGIESGWFSSRGAIGYLSLFTLMIGTVWLVLLVSKRGMSRVNV